MCKIKEAYVSFEVAKLLKIKGFDEDTIGYYNSIAEIPERIKFFDSPISIYNSYGLIGCIQAPTHQMAMKWLREVHNINIEIKCTKNNNEAFIMTIEKLPRCLCRGISSNKYEEAVEAALKYTLKNLI